MPLSPWTQETQPLPLAQIPEPSHSLLAQASILTPHLEAYHQDTIRLKTVTAQIEAGWLTRRVLLCLESDARVVELGAIRVALDHLPDQLREATLAGKRAFGSLLDQAKFPYQAGKQVFFSVEAQDLINPPPLPKKQKQLYGRTHDILTPEGEALAFSSEILTGL